MKNESAYNRKIGAFLKKAASHKAEPLPRRDPVSHLVAAFLNWDATRKEAEAAHHRLTGVLVDHNDLRVSHVHEVAALLGPRYPRGEERAGRLHEALQEIYVREHAMSLDHLTDKGKRQARQYLDTLPGTPSYVAAYVSLACFGGSGIPVDHKLLEQLKAQGVVDPTATAEQAEVFIDKHVKADHALDTHLSLQAWSDAQAAKAKPDKPGKSTAKKPSKKPAKK